MPFTPLGQLPLSAPLGGPLTGWVRQPDGGWLFVGRGSVASDAFIDLNVPIVRLVRDTVSIANNTVTDLGFPDTDFIRGFDTTTTPRNPVVLRAGIYLISFNCTWQTAAAGTRRMVRIRLNGAIADGIQDDRASINEADASISGMLALEAGDEVGVDVFQVSGGALNVNGELALVYLSALIP